VTSGRFDPKAFDVAAATGEMLPGRARLEADGLMVSRITTPFAFGDGLGAVRPQDWPKELECGHAKNKSEATP
jgi:hypothetical protein